MDDRAQLRLGFSVLALLAVGVGLVVGLEGKHLRRGLILHVQVSRTGALTTGAKVRVSGRTIGSVDAIRMLPRRALADDHCSLVRAERAPALTKAMGGPEPSAIEADVWIDRRYAWLVREDSEIFLNQIGILGEAYLEVGPPTGAAAEATGGSPGKLLDDGATVCGVDPPRLDELAGKSYENLMSAVALLREGLPELHQLGAALAMLDDTLSTLDPTPVSVAEMMSANRRGFEELLTFTDTLKQTDVTPARLGELAAHGRMAVGKARAQIADLRRRIAPLLANIDALRPRLDPARFDKFEAALRQQDALLAKVDVGLAQVDELMAYVERGEGTIGAFLHDNEISDDIKAAVKATKHQPWRTIAHPQ